MELTVRIKGLSNLLALCELVGWQAERIFDDDARYNGHHYHYYIRDEGGNLIGMAVSDDPHEEFLVTVEK